MTLEVYRAQVAKSPTQFADVPIPGECEEVHIEGAENIDVLPEGFLIKMDTFDREAPAYILLP